MPEHRRSDRSLVLRDFYLCAAQAKGRASNRGSMTWLFPAFHLDIPGWKINTSRSGTACWKTISSKLLKLVWSIICGISRSGLRPSEFLIKKASSLCQGSVITFLWNEGLRQVAEVCHLMYHLKLQPSKLNAGASSAKVKATQLKCGVCIFCPSGPVMHTYQQATRLDLLGNLEALSLLPSLFAWNRLVHVVCLTYILSLRALVPSPLPPSFLLRSGF